MPTYEQIFAELQKRKSDLSTWTIEELEKGLQEKYFKKKKEKEKAEKEQATKKGDIK